ncbi:MAG TPA: copper resistance protein CopC [Bacillota bacterium]
MNVHPGPRQAAFRAIAALVTVALGMASLAAIVAAHAYVAESEPAEGAVVEPGLEVVRVAFTEPIETGLSRLRVIGPTGEEVSGQQEAISDRELRLALDQPLPAGEYRIAWEVLAKDGHVTEGTITFTVRGEAASGAEGVDSDPAQVEPPVSRPRAEPPAVGNRSGSAEAGASPNAVVTVALILAAIVVAAAWLRGRRPS